MKKLLFLILLFYSYNCFCQDTELLKTRITKQFVENTEKYSLNYSWLACNKDSAYYLSDTLKLYNHINYTWDSSNCCYFVQWNFENECNFRLVESNYCEEPPTEKVDLNNLFSLTWKTEGKKLHIVIENKKKKIKEEFMICDFYEETLSNKKNKCMVLKIVHMKN